MVSKYHGIINGNFPLPGFVQLNNATLIRGDSYTTITIPVVERGVQLNITHSVVGSGNKTEGINSILSESWFSIQFSLPK